MASTRPTREADIFSSSPARPSHHRTQLPPRKPGDVDGGSRAFPGGSNTKNSLKRTASAALLTPPGSPEKEKRRSSKRTLTDSEDEDEDEEMASPGRANGARPRRNVTKKPARTSTMVVRERRAQGRLGAAEGSIVFPRGRQASTNATLQPLHRAGASTSPDGMQVDHIRLDSDDGEHGSPMQPSTPKHNIAALPTVPEPTTPTRPRTRSQTRSKRPNPVRDSPNNPFLGGSPRTGPREPVEEKATMTYVFRGVKAVFRNPNYGGPDVETQARHRLHPANPDFSPDLMTAPKLLFPSAAGASGFDSDDDRPVTPRYNLRNSPGRMTTPSPRGRATKRRRVGEASGSADALFGGPKTPGGEAMA